MATPNSSPLASSASQPTQPPNASSVIETRTTALVDFNSLPPCASRLCISLSHTSLPCPTLTTACSPKQSESGNSDSNSTSAICTSVPLSCYCALANPLLCAWPCTWFEWLLAEDWYASTCPSVPPIDFSALPFCAKTCLEDRVFNYGCITYQKNCFCSHQNLFGCSIGCSTQDNITLTDWYAGLCDVPQSSALQIAAVQTTMAGVVPQSRKWSGFAWYETFTLVVAILCGVIFFAYLTFWREWIVHRDTRRIDSQKKKALSKHD